MQKKKKEHRLNLLVKKDSGIMIVQLMIKEKGTMLYELHFWKQFQQAKYFIASKFYLSA